MRRARVVATSVVAVLLAAPLAVEAEETGRRHRVALLVSSAPGTRQEVAFRDGLRALGHVEGSGLTVEGSGLTVEVRHARGQLERLPALARELLDTRPAVIVTFGSAAARAAKRATTTTPIVMAFAGDPVGEGLVASLARPGGNVTGVGLAIADIAGKRVQLLKESMPKLARLTVLGDLSRQMELRQTQEAARTLGVTVALVELARTEGLDEALREVLRTRPDAVLVLNNAFTAVHRTRLTAFALANRLPLVSGTSGWTAAGALMDYAPSLPDSSRRAAVYVDKILKGAKPADLPVEQPTKFDLTINLKTAKALSLTIPPSVLVRADQVIE